MKIEETNIIELKKIRDLKESFDKSMKIPVEIYYPKNGKRCI